VRGYSPPFTANAPLSHAPTRERRRTPQPAVQLAALRFATPSCIGEPKLRPAAFSTSFARSCTHPAIVLGALALSIVLIRLPFNLNTGADEAFYLIVGRQWLHGAPPYAGTFDVKPPLLFLLMAGAEALFGPTLLAAKALANAAAVLTGFALYLIGLRYLGSLAGVLAAIFYTFGAISLGGTFSTAEGFMAPFIAFAMLAGLAAFPGSRPLPIAALLLAGLLLGAAACVKQTAVFSAAPLVLGLAVTRAGSSRLKAALASGAGFCAFPAGFALYFFAIGHLGDFLGDTVLMALRRAGTAYLSWSAAFGMMMAGFLSVLPVLVLAGLLWVERRPLRPHPVYPTVQFLAAWAAGAFLGVFITKDLSVIYALPVMPPLCLMAGGFIQHVLGRIEGQRRRLLWRTGTVAAALLYSCYIVTPVYFEGLDEVKAAEAAAALIRREGGQPGGRIFVVDRDLLVYVTSGAEPPLPIFHPLQLLCPFPAEGAQSAWAESMKTKPAFVVLADPPVALRCEVPGRRETIRMQLSQDYCPLGRFESSATAWSGPFTVFGLKERSGAGPSGACPTQHSSKLQPAAE
jgi:4-amino-4-deoxy-L-arabinose transferase-like glycosyltransferase